MPQLDGACDASVAAFGQAHAAQLARELPDVPTALLPRRRELATDEHGHSFGNDDGEVVLAELFPKTLLAAGEVQLDARVEHDHVAPAASHVQKPRIVDEADVSRVEHPPPSARRVSSGLP